MGELDNIFDRIQYIIDKEKLNISSFSKEIGVVDQTMRNILKRRSSKPGYEVLYKILQKYAWIDARWLITGEVSESLNNDKILNIESGANEDFYKNLIASQQEIIKNLSEAVRDAKKVPVHKSIAKCAGAE